MQKQLQEERLQRAQARAQAEIKKKVGRVARGVPAGEGPLTRHSGAGRGWGPAAEPGSPPLQVLIAEVLGGRKMGPSE